MALNPPYWIEEIKKWICLTPIFGLCSQTLLCLIWGEGTGFGEHKGKNAGLLSWERGCVGFPGGWPTRGPWYLGFYWVTVWKVYTLPGSSVSGILRSSRISWGILMTILWEFSFGNVGCKTLSCEWWEEKKERKEEILGLSLSLWSDHIYPFHSHRHRRLLKDREPFRCSLLLNVTFIRCRCTVQR